MNIKFTNEIGMKLAGRLEWPISRETSTPAVIFAHGFDSGKDSSRGMAVAAALREAGTATFLIDFTGHGESEGSRNESTIERQVNDLLSAVDYLNEIPEIDMKNLGLCGASSGGLVALKTALRENRIRGVALRGPRTDGMTPRADEFRIPILVVQGDLDPLLPESERFVRALRGKAKIEIVPGADHLFSGPGQTETVAALTVAWFGKLFFGRSREVA